VVRVIVRVRVRVRVRNRVSVRVRVRVRDRVVLAFFCHCDLRLDLSAFTMTCPELHCDVMSFFILSMP
jgi:hypothetical protein